MKCKLLWICIVHSVMAGCGVYPQASRGISDPKYTELLAVVENMVLSGRLPASTVPLVIVTGSRDTPMILNDAMVIGEQKITYQLILSPMGFEDVHYVSILAFDDRIQPPNRTPLVLQWDGHQWKQVGVGMFDFDCPARGGLKAQ